MAAHIPLAVLRCSEDPDVKGTETEDMENGAGLTSRCSEDPDVKGTETWLSGS